MAAKVQTKKPALKESKRFKILETKLVPLSRIKVAKYNPPERMSNDDCNQLAQSMDDVGQILPVWLDPDYNLVDGHRRLKGAQINGWRDILANIVSHEMADFLYSIINGMSRRLKGNQLLFVYLENPRAVYGESLKKHQTAEKLVGRDMLRHVRDKGHSLWIVNNAWRVSNYCNMGGGREPVTKVLKWILKHEMSGFARKCIDAKVSPKVLADAIKNDKKIKMDIAMA